jgi:Guanosine polyphosphate pyrophosphohydrolases/synthetases
MQSDDLVAKAVELAARVHACQKDIGGAPYILHPMRVMGEMECEQTRIIAALHDTVEDGEGFSVGIVRRHFGDRIAAAVDALTKREGEDYDDYLQRVKSDELALKVKLADLKDNSDIFRLGRVPTAEDKKRLDKYLRARAFLSLPA